ncbi:hypothetical protein [Siphonobacter sp. SORGH_AS_1065]|uniref:hypothetical protein n=1 Tax=Siphonobacter sp. SORGH_AS_1065 TaxID=3041795 RepID=UPI0027842635|nr:hypothetical protein [Siphonobacter sp. SORGH_AS_1065]MDQ1089709.1 hypothetical protein [Siphonobacter sp. SORGH_AS_1065]
MKTYILLVFSLLGIAMSSHAQPTQVDKNLVVEDDLLTEEKLRDFQTLTQQKVTEFQRYLAIISDPTQSDEVRELAIENAEKLFLPGAAMQVGTVKKQTLIQEYPLSIYLRRLKNLEKKYFDVSITFYDLAMVGDWEKTQTGYVTTATYFQHFKGKGKDGKIAYEDKTIKHLDVDLRNRRDPFYEEHRWTVLLGNIRVAEVQPKKSAL